MKFRQLFLSLFVLTILMLIFPMNIKAQIGAVQGRVFDASNGEILPGVNIIIDGETVTASDKEGAYSSMLEPGKHTLVFKFIGYSERKINISLVADDVIRKDIYLEPQSIELNTTVVSASRYEQRMSDVIVSMEVMAAKFIRSVNTYYLDETISLLPGIDIVDGQASIRGGGGYTYGAGSRVLVLMDGLPIITGGVGDVKWNSLPIEIVEQVEIIKGASSALYGTSALNGVINLRTAAPGLKPLTSVEVSMGAYTKPERKEIAWFWNRNPLFANLKFSHLQKAGAFDIVIGGSGLYDEGYRQDNDMQYGRLYAGVRYHPGKIKALSVGINAGYQLQDLTDFLIWQDADSGAYIQNPLAVTPMHGYRLNLDPYTVYFDEHGGRHSLKTRYYRVVNQFEEDEDKNNNSDVYFGEYQYQITFFKKLQLTAGAAFSYTEGKTSLYNNHYGSTQALYSQFDYKLFDCLGVSLGLRWERYTLDKSDKESRPVFRTGLNYHAAKLTYLRASFGQGYRYPSMAEKYTSTSLGGLNIFPNNELKPETGWSAEIGIKQGLLFDKWSAYVDFAAFWTEYNDMIEFVFGLYNPPGEPATIEHIGFRSLNTGKARINGIDVLFNAQAGIGAFILNCSAGYTYMNPLDLSKDSTIAESGESQILKYRYRHSVKGNVGLQYQHLDVLITVVYRSFMERIDAAFEENILGQYFFPGLKEYREENNTGSVVVNVGFGWQFTNASKLSLFVNNIFNEEYMGRPGDLQPPRSISLQYLLKINPVEKRIVD